VTSRPLSLLQRPNASGRGWPGVLHDYEARPAFGRATPACPSTTPLSWRGPIFRSATIPTWGNGKNNETPPGHEQSPGGVGPPPPVPGCPGSDRLRRCGRQPFLVARLEAGSSRPMVVSWLPRHAARLGRKPAKLRELRNCWDWARGPALANDWAGTVGSPVAPNAYPRTWMGRTRGNWGGGAHCDNGAGEA